MDCALCPALVESRRQVVDRAVIGDGVAKILLVGQAPGKDEDIVGQPFVGKSGKKLKAMLAELGIKDYVVTNSVRCYPDHDRKPNLEELNNCSWHLASDILEVNPNLIIAVGDVAEGAVYKALAIAGLDIEVRKVLHPSAVLHRPSLQARFESEMEAALNPAKILLPLDYVALPQGPTEGQISSDLIAYDVETDGEDGGEAVSIQRAWREGGKIVASFELLERKTV